MGCHPDDPWKRIHNRTPLFYFNIKCPEKQVMPINGILARQFLSGFYFKKGGLGAVDKLLKINEVAEILNVSLDRAYTLSREGIIPSVRIGRSLRFSEGDISDFIKQGGKGYEES